MAIKKLYSSDSRRKTISKLNNNFVSISPDVILEISDITPTENVRNTIWIDTSMDIRTKEIDTRTYADTYFTSHPDIDKTTFKFIGDNGKPTLEFKKMLYGDDYDSRFKYILIPKNNTLLDFWKPIEKQSNLPKYDLSGIHFKPGKITRSSLFALFRNAIFLKNINISNFDTSEATNMTDMFYGCRSLKSLDLSNWDTSKVTSMESSFAECDNLVSLDISNWDTSNVTSMADMFRNSTKINTIKGVFDFKKCRDCLSMFSNCDNLTSIKVKNLHTDIDSFCVEANIDKSKVIVVG